MVSSSFPEIPCTICSKALKLISDLFADENGKGVHEECYVQRITGSSSNPAAADGRLILAGRVEVTADIHALAGWAILRSADPSVTTAALSPDGC